MHITSAAIQLGSGRQYAEQRQERESLRIRQGNRTLDFQRESTSLTAFQSRENLVFGRLSDRMELSGQARRAATQLRDQAAEDLMDVAEHTVTTKEELVKVLLEKILGSKFKVKEFEEPETDTEELASQFGLGPAESGNGPSGPAGPPGFGLAYDYHESYLETERTAFQASGTVKTADGREIQFDLDLEMSREYYTEQNLSIRIGEQLTDPLVVNFGGGTAQLSNARFSFDLDSDGTEEEMHFLAGGSGFLALDLNGDGSINNGSELFGTQSGDGFGDLAAYDEDGNGFIDEGDSVFDQLLLYNKDAQGTDRLQSLADQGIGAIYLGSASTEFSLKDTDNQTLGQVRRSGVFLRENGSVGSVQQVDLATFDGDERSQDDAGESGALDAVGAATDADQEAPPFLDLSV
ncbi:hypothetical protein SCOR_03565 [Sulfidibacter corallicola]|uniref:VCBS repeat-containing protein n=1 Tax=Sulfidibacter corallicola TaxID=2818388 RepID=A0A8A4TGR0_SULCO|nr:hypothetical protein [Sulfidibacter corallicola]QTD48394.1 hypothetical protein J3U87_22670 [Sulfidibacter corallicola]